MSRNELRSSLLAAVSLASETELLIGQLEEGRVTVAFAQGQFTYLDNEAMRSANELREARTDRPLDNALRTGLIQLDSLAKTLSAVKEKATEAENLVPGRQEAARIAGILLRTAKEL